MCGCEAAFSGIVVAFFLFFIGVMSERICVAFYLTMQFSQLV